MGGVVAFLCSDDAQWMDNGETYGVTNALMRHNPVPWNVALLLIVNK